MTELERIHGATECVRMPGVLPFTLARWRAVKLKPDLHSIPSRDEYDPPAVRTSAAARLLRTAAESAAEYPAEGRP